MKTLTRSRLCYLIGMYLRSFSPTSLHFLSLTSITLFVGLANFSYAGDSDIIHSYILNRLLCENLSHVLAPQAFNTEFGGIC